MWLHSITLHSIILLWILISFNNSLKNDDDDDLTYKKLARLLFDLDESAWSEVNLNLEENFGVEKDYFNFVTKNVTECELCKSGLGILIDLIKHGKTYEDLRNLSIAVCHPIVVKQGYNPDLLCPMLLDIYGPHVVYILNVTNKSSSDICTIYKFCPYDKSKPNILLESRTNTELPVFKNRPESSPFVKEKNGNKNENNLKILHISDTHPDDLYAAGSQSICDMPLCCRTDSNGNGSAKYWGDYTCNTPPRTISYMFEFIAKNLKPDIIIYTGDTPMHTVYNQTLESTISSYEWLTSQLSYYFPGIPAFPTFGNHDTFPTNLYSSNITESQELNSNMYLLWKNLAGFQEEQEKSIKYGGYYEIDVNSDLKVISINSNLVYLENFYCILNMENDIFEMLHFLRSSLQSARLAGQKVILINHQLSGGDDFIAGYDEVINEIRSQFHDEILLNLVGHSHHDQFSMIRFNTTNSLGVQLVAPSMTTYREVNPSFRMVYVDADTLLLKDLETYRLDITADGDSESPTIFKAYSFLNNYNMADLSYSSFDDLIYRMRINETLMEQYRINYASGRAINSCDLDCQQEISCSQAYADYVKRNECINTN